MEQTYTKFMYRAISFIVDLDHCFKRKTSCAKATKVVELAQPKRLGVDASYSAMLAFMTSMLQNAEVTTKPYSPEVIREEC